MRYTPEGHAVTRFSLATDRATRPGAEPVTDWHQVICWRKLAEFAGEYLAKGRLVAVSGHLTYRAWEGRDGQRRRTAEVIATEVVLLDRRPDGGAREAEPAEASPDSPTPEDDIPF
jgi:single-strand DNA-binding protein